MLVTLKEILAIAEEKKMAVGAFNAANLESLEGKIRAAEETGMPIVLQFAQCHEELVPLKVIGPVMVAEAKRAKVPVCVHLDHGEDLAFLEEALKIGFTGIMYDGSTRPYEENLEETRKAVALAASFGASVEAELGSMGRRESGLGDGSGEEDETKIYTDPELAARFVRESGIAALACSFGTTHGIYLKKPKLDFSVVSRVREKTGGIPVVMHGGSGVSAEDFRRAIRAGVRKINYFTYMDKAAGAAAEKALEEMRAAGAPVFFTVMASAAREAMKQDVMKTIRVFSMDGETE